MLFQSEVISEKGMLRRGSPSTRFRERNLGDFETNQSPDDDSLTKVYWMLD